MAEKVKETPRRSKVSGKNQVTLPVSVLDAANMRSGDVLEIIAEGDGVVRLRRVSDPWWEAFGKLVGSVPGASRDDLEELRDEWER